MTHPENETETITITTPIKSPTKIDQGTKTLLQELQDWEKQLKIEENKPQEYRESHAITYCQYQINELKEKLKEDTETENFPVTSIIDPEPEITPEPDLKPESVQELISRAEQETAVFMDKKDISNQSTIEKIEQYNNLNHEDLQLTLEEYRELIRFYIETVKEWIDRYTQKKYTSYILYPTDLELILVLIVSRIISNQKIRQETPFMDLENYKLREQIDTVMTEDILLQLRPFRKRPKINILKLK